MLAKRNPTFGEELGLLVRGDEGLVVPEGGVEALSEGLGVLVRRLLLAQVGVQAGVDALIGEPDGFGCMFPLELLDVEAGLLETAGELRGVVRTWTRSSRRQSSSPSSPIPVIFISPQRKKQAKE